MTGIEKQRHRKKHSDKDRQKNMSLGIMRKKVKQEKLEKQNKLLPTECKAVRCRT